MSCFLVFLGAPDECWRWNWPLWFGWTFCCFGFLDVLRIAGAAFKGGWVVAVAVRAFGWGFFVLGASGVMMVSSAFDALGCSPASGG